MGVVWWVCATKIHSWRWCRWLGVDHIYLTENGPAPAESFMAELQEFIDDGFITFRNDPKPSFQQTIYVDCMTQHRHKHNWMAFIDLDEFIVLRKCVPLTCSLLPCLRTKPSEAVFTDCELGSGWIIGVTRRGLHTHAS